MIIRYYFFVSLVGVLFLGFSSCEKQKIPWNLKSLPELGLVELENYDAYTIQLKCDLRSNGFDASTVKGFCYSNTENPSIENNVIRILNSDEGVYLTGIEWFDAQSIYIRAFAENELGTVYSDNSLKVNFPTEEGYLPIITTVSIEAVGFYDVRVGSSIEFDADLPIVSRGICISSQTDFDLSNSLVFTSTSSEANFSTFADGLSENQVYYMRSFVENLAGIGYGQVLSFTTKTYYEIGETGPTGGFIFYNKIDTVGGWNFLEMYTTDIGGSAKWGSNSNFLSTQLDIGSGESNTSQIVDFFGPSENNAARICMDFNVNGVSDWYLPSRNELLAIRNNLHLNGIGFLSPNGIYWSSSQDDTFPENAWSVQMNSQDVNQSVSYPKSTLLSIRPVRKL